MTNPMIERAINAVMSAPTRNATFGDFIHEDEAESVVRAVIAAMREPTEAMVEAPVPESVDFGEGDDHGAVWRTMIDAALAEEGR